MAADEERHARGFLEETSPADKAKMTIAEFCEQRFLRFHAVTVRATRKVLSAMCQMAFDEGYRTNNPIRSIPIQQAPAKPILVASHDHWRRLEEALTYPPARLYARLNVTTWARRCEVIGFRPCDFAFGSRC